MAWADFDTWSDRPGTADSTMLKSTLSASQSIQIGYLLTSIFVCTI